MAVPLSQPAGLDGTNMPRMLSPIGITGLRKAIVSGLHRLAESSRLIRLESLVAEATSAPRQALIAEAVDLVIFVDEEPDLKAGRKVRELLLVTGYRDGRYQVEHV
jgi:Flp pilus assembly CpaF family ATPase